MSDQYNEPSAAGREFVEDLRADLQEYAWPTGVNDLVARTFDAHAQKAVAAETERCSKIAAAMTHGPRCPQTIAAIIRAVRRGE